MKVIVSENAQQLGKKAAELTAQYLREAIAEKGSARIILSTGASQFTTLEALVKEDVDWSKVEMFHLDEYVNLPQDHPASFVRYLKERFVEKTGGLKAVHFVDTSIGTDAIIEKLTGELKEHLEAHIADCEKELDDDAESIITNQRYSYISSVVHKAVKKKRAAHSMSTSDKIDRVVTNRILALPIFVAS